MESEKETLDILREILLETLLKRLFFTSDDGCEIEEKICPLFENFKSRLEVLYYDRVP